ncbi:Mbeg1-like protein [Enterococcus rivorum]|uniref:Triacylglycerol lipase n=1 Tax=Enterococcus rivorum TaxID=762845 RepID=A0A1E5KYI7_9ENTE|nr:Mbeg1-like protein [Enterococcus rivorum]MBP2097496.1 DNA-binding XRE family transcriptional regulator [Enterococcus rivorum]OEH82952.1 triacylglycerol lipase [Enterococcus rivorum]
MANVQKELDDYNKLSNESYQVESNNVQVGDRVVDDKYLVLDTIDTNKDTLKTESIPRKNSMQAMTVAEIKDEYKIEKRLEKVPGYPKSVVKKDITIVYAGTSSFKDWTTDFIEIGMNAKYENGAFSSALDYANEIERKYPKENGFTIGTTGHSLGGAEAIYVAVLLGYNAFTYGAAGSGLSDEQIKQYKGTIVNLFDTTDAVTSGVLTGGRKKIPFLSIGIDNPWWRTAGHSLDQFQVDKKGNYINKYGDIVVYSNLNGGISIEQTLLAQSIVENNIQMRRLDHYGVDKMGGKKEYQRLKKENEWLQTQIDSFTKLNVLRKKLTKSGGGLSGNEQIYLDDSQALTIVKLASSKFDMAMENVVKLYKDAVRELEEMWQEGRSTIQSNCPDLSYGEVLDAMQAMGCTEQTMVTIPSQEFQEKLSLAHRMSSKFSSLTKDITAKIGELVQRDQELARQLA